MCSFAHDLLLYPTSEMAHPFCHKSDILLMKEMTTNNIYFLRNNYVYNMPTNQLFSLNFTISNQSASGIKSEIRPLICQRTHYGNLERQKRQNRFKSSSFQITAAMFFKFCKLIMKIIVALDNNSATFVFLVGF